MANQQAFQKPADAEQINARAGDLMLAIYRFQATRPVNVLSVAMLMILLDNITKVGATCLLMGMTEEQYMVEVRSIMKLVDQEVG